MLTTILSQTADGSKQVGVLTDKGVRLVTIRCSITGCCGLNSLEQIATGYFHSAAKVEEFFQELAKAPWKFNKEGPQPYYAMKHFIFTCGVGHYYEHHQREDAYKFLIANPRTKLINRYPSASEPGHDIGIFFVDLT